MILIRPALASGNTAVVVVNVIDVSPDATAIVAGAAPLYGTCVMRVPVIDFNSSPARCPGEPGPFEENDN